MVTPCKPTTVGELIEALDKVDFDTPIFVEYDGGLFPLIGVKEAADYVVLNDCGSRHYGKGCSRHAREVDNAT